MKKDNFAAHVAAQEAAQKHAKEIQKTRVGGLGGSDAALIYKIGLKGMDSLSLTDTKRLCVMLGLLPVDTWSGNAYTEAGHLFENYAELAIPFGTHGYERERVLALPLALSFKVFAHADFATGADKLDIIECKFVQAGTDEVASRYYAQLQWYYMLGAQSVTLYHGRGTVEPFNVDEGSVKKIDRDEEAIKILLQGIKTLDSAILSGWRPAVPDRAMLSDTPAVVQRAFDELDAVKQAQTALDERKKTATATVREYIEAFGLTGIVGDAYDKDKRQVVYTRASVSKKFNAKKYLEDHPEVNEMQQYWELSERAASISFK